MAPCFDVAEACEAEGHCRLVKAFDSGHKKIMFVGRHRVTVRASEGNVKETTIGSVCARLLDSVGAERKTGKAPMGWMEKQLSAYLDHRRKVKR